jgi:hypothetical protein
LPIANDYQGIAERGKAIERIAANDGLKGALVSIDASNERCHRRDDQADYFLAVKANRPTLRSEIESFFANASPASLERTTDVDRVMAASSNEPSLFPRGRLARWRSPVFPANSACWTSRRSSGCPHGPSSKTAAGSRTLFRVFRSPLGHWRGRGRARPLGHRE